MKFFRLKKFVLVFPFLIYLNILMFKMEFNKKFNEENITTLPKPISSSFKKSVHLHSKSVIDLLNCSIKNNTILIFEQEFFHQECTPGYTKYFLDLGYNVDVIFDNLGRNTFCLFNSLENIRIFIFYRLSQFSAHSKEFQLVFKNYSYIVIESTEPCRKKTYKDLGFFKMNNTIFVVHQFKYMIFTGISNFYNQNRIWSLGNLKNSLYVNPHYYGDIKIRKKNKRTKFFITSTIYRKYKDLALAAKKLKNENLDFEVIVIGKKKYFSKKDLPENLQENFKFKYRVIFKELYEAVYSSDYIIINLYPNYKNNDIFRSERLTGASQLSFGFLKPSLIHKSFAEFYNMSSKNSFLFNNSNLYEIMREAILLNAQEYKEKQQNLIKLSDSLYKMSLNNIKKTFNSILFNKIS
jgi:hypothetical protein